MYVISVPFKKVYLVKIIKFDTHFTGGIKLVKTKYQNLEIRKFTKTILMSSECLMIDFTKLIIFLYNLQFWGLFTVV